MLKVQFDQTAHAMKHAKIMYSIQFCNNRLSSNWTNQLVQEDYKFTMYSIGYLDIAFLPNMAQSGPRAMISSRQGSPWTLECDPYKSVTIKYCCCGLDITEQQFASQLII